VAVPNGNWTVGTPYVLKLVTPSGSFSFPLVAGGNSNSVIQPQPNLIAFQTVTAQTVTPQFSNQTVFAQDYFLTNAYEMTGVISGSVLLIAAIVGLGGVWQGARNEGKWPYGEKRARSRHAPLFITIGLAAVGIITLSIATPLLQGIDVNSRIPYLFPAVLALVLITSILALAGVVGSVLRGRRKSLRGGQEDEAETTVSEPTPNRDEIPTQLQAVKTKCRYCQTEVPSGTLICPKCGMPAGYL
jgi:hypothetical protein